MFRCFGMRACVCRFLLLSLILFRWKCAPYSPFPFLSAHILITPPSTSIQPSQSEKDGVEGASDDHFQ